MIAEIVAIGTELLMGQIADSDAQMLSRELQSLGIAVYHHQVVGDNPQRMREALALALSRSDLVITTGGLGPTQDDLSTVRKRFEALSREEASNIFELWRQHAFRRRGSNDDAASVA